MIPKFRYWHKELKEMCLVDVVEFNSVTGELIGLGDGISYFYPAVDIILMQSTGLFDKNGVEIFEGDVVAYFDGDEQISENIIIRYGEHTNIDTVLKDEPKHIGFYIEVTKGTATFDVTDMYEEYKENIKVIGNIHDNPELVEVG